MKFPAESVCPPTEEARASSQFEFRIPTPRHGALNNPVGKGNIPPPLNLNVEKKLSEYNTEIVGQEVKTPIIKPTALTSSSMSSTPILGFQNLSTSAGSNNSNLSTPVDDTMIFSSPDGSIATKIPGKFSDGLIRTPANSGFSPFVLSTPSYPVSYQIIDRPDLGFLRSPETPFAVRAEFNRQIPSLSHLMGTTIGKGYVHQLQMNQDLNEKNSCSTPPVGYMVPPSLTNSPGTFPKIPQALRIPHMVNSRFN